VPIFDNQRVLGNGRDDLFHVRALDRAEIVSRYVPLIKALADNVAVSVASLRQS